MASHSNDFGDVLESHHETRKGMVREIAKQPSTTQEKEAAEQARTRPVKAIRN